MEFAYDPDKDAINLAKHGVSLTFGQRVWDDPDVVVTPTIRVEDGERRFRAIGRVDDRLWTAVHVNRGEVVRLISVRRSNDGEVRTYHRP